MGVVLNIFKRGCVTILDKCETVVKIIEFVQQYMAEIRAVILGAKYHSGKDERIYRCTNLIIFVLNALTFGIPLVSCLFSPSLHKLLTL